MTLQSTPEQKFVVLGFKTEGDSDPYYIPFEYREHELTNTAEEAHRNLRGAVIGQIAAAELAEAGLIEAPQGPLYALDDQNRLQIQEAYIVNSQLKKLIGRAITDDEIQNTPSEEIDNYEGGFTDITPQMQLLLADAYDREEQLTLSS